MCSTVQERISTCGRNAIVKIGERTNIRPQKRVQILGLLWILLGKANFVLLMKAQIT